MCVCVYMCVCVFAFLSLSNSPPPFFPSLTPIPTLQVKGEKEVLAFYRQLAECSIDMLTLTDSGQFYDELAVQHDKQHLVISSYLRSAVVRVKSAEFDAR